MVTLPGIVTQSRSWLKLGGVMATLCAMFSMVIGLYLWILTLKTKDDMAPIWRQQSDAVQELMQTAVG